MRSGFWLVGIKRGSNRLPMPHVPPIHVPNNTASDMAFEPITSCSKLQTVTIFVDQSRATAPERTAQEELAKAGRS